LPSPDAEEEEFAVEIIDTDCKNPMEVILEKEMEERKQINLSKLSPLEQRIIAMREEGQQFKDIALQLGMPSTTARTKYRRATLKLKSLMEISDELD
jgi:DNA-directed RNA polymerase specialized sigma24 family protein